MSFLGKLASLYLLLGAAAFAALRWAYAHVYRPYSVTPEMVGLSHAEVLARSADVLLVLVLLYTAVIIVLWVLIATLADASRHHRPLGLANKVAAPLTVAILGILIVGAVLPRDVDMARTAIGMGKATQPTDYCILRLETRPIRPPVIAGEHGEETAADRALWLGQSEERAVVVMDGATMVLLEPEQIMFEPVPADGRGESWYDPFPQCLWASFTREVPPRASALAVAFSRYSLVAGIGVFVLGIAGRRWGWRIGLPLGVAILITIGTIGSLYPSLLAPRGHAEEAASLVVLGILGLVVVRFRHGNGP